MSTRDGTADEEEARPQTSTRDGTADEEEARPQTSTRDGTADEEEARPQMMQMITREKVSIVEMNVTVTDGIVKVNTAIGTKGIAVILLVMQTSTNPGGSNIRGLPQQAIKQGQIMPVVTTDHGMDKMVLSLHIRRRWLTSTHMRSRNRQQHMSTPPFFRCRLSKSGRPCLCEKLKSQVSKLDSSSIFPPCDTAHV
jgi:hypothetical protein